MDLVGGAMWEATLEGDYGFDTTAILGAVDGLW